MPECWDNLKTWKKALILILSIGLPVGVVVIAAIILIVLAAIRVI